MEERHPIRLRLILDLDLWSLKRDGGYLRKYTEVGESVKFAA